MNDEELTTLLEGLGGQVEVGPPPVERVAIGGRQRRRVRRAVQLTGVAAAVAAIAAGGLALRPILSQSGSTTSPGAGATTRPTAPTSTPDLGLPGRPPTAHQLIGNWRTTGLPMGHGANTLPLNADGLSFRELGGLRWGGDDGCNAWFGDVRLGRDGTFATVNDGSTLVGCLGPGKGSAVDVIRRATQVRLLDGQLTFYDSADRLLGTFVRT